MILRMISARIAAHDVQVLHLDLQRQELQHHRPLLLPDHGDVLHVHGCPHEDEYAGKYPLSDVWSCVHCKILVEAIELYHLLIILIVNIQKFSIRKIFTLFII